MCIFSVIARSKFWLSFFQLVLGSNGARARASRSSVVSAAIASAGLRGSHIQLTITSRASNCPRCCTLLPNIPHPRLETRKNLVSAGLRGTHMQYTSKRVDTMGFSYEFVNFRETKSV